MPKLDTENRGLHIAYIKAVLKGKYGIAFDPRNPPANVNPNDIYDLASWWMSSVGPQGATPKACRQFYEWYRAKYVASGTMMVERRESILKHWNTYMLEGQAVTNARWKSGMTPLTPEAEALGLGKYRGDPDQERAEWQRRYDEMAARAQQELPPPDPRLAAKLRALATGQDISPFGAQNQTCDSVPPCGSPDGHSRTKGGEQ